MTPKKIVIHCSATKDGHNLSLESLEAAHRARGFKSIGYHYVIGVTGRLDQTRAEHDVGAHVIGANTDSLGICLVGNILFHVEQFHTLRKLVLDLMKAYDIKLWNIWVHNEFPSAKIQKKTCPNVRTTNLIAYLASGDTDAIIPWLFPFERSI